MPSVRSTCPYCAVGCGLIVNTKDGQVTDVRGDPHHPSNYGRLCSKGALLPAMLQAAHDYIKNNRTGETEVARAAPSRSASRSMTGSNT